MEQKDKDNNFPAEQIERELSIIRDKLPPGTDMKQVFDVALAIQNGLTNMFRNFYRFNLTLSLFMATAAGGLLIGQKVAENTENLLPPKMYERGTQVEMNDLAKKAGLLGIFFTFVTMGNRRALQKAEYKTDVLKFVAGQYTPKAPKSDKSNGR